MTSIHTNTAAVAALSTLRAISGSLETTQQQASSGLRVETSKDNAAYWSIATTMRSDNKAMSTVKDNIGLSQAILDTAYTGMDQIRQNLDKIKSLVVMASNLPQAQTNGALPTGLAPYNDDVYENSEVFKVDQEIMQHWDQIRNTALDSSFSGVNLLVNENNDGILPNQSVEFVTGYNDGHVLTTTVSRTDTTVLNYARTTVNDQWGGADTENLGFADGEIGLFTYPLTSVWDSPAFLIKNQFPYMLRTIEDSSLNWGFDRKTLYDGMVNDVDTRIQALTNGMAVVGAVQKRLEMQDDFTSTLQDTVTKGVGRLVDADMNETSTRIKALQTQQQLGIQALSIANSQSDAIMQLFR